MAQLPTAKITDRLPVSPLQPTALPKRPVATARLLLTPYPASAHLPRPLQRRLCRYGLRIGYHLAPLMRLLMFLSLPIAWPIGKILDLMLGHGHHTLFRRRQLKELVT